MIRTVQYNYGPYTGTIDIKGDPNDDDDVTIARAWKRLPHTTLSMAARSAEIISIIREDSDDE